MAETNALISNLEALLQLQTLGLLPDCDKEMSATIAGYRDSLQNAKSVRKMAVSTLAEHLNGLSKALANSLLKSTDFKELSALVRR